MLTYASVAETRFRYIPRQEFWENSRNTRSQIQTAHHVEADFAVRGDMGPEQRRQRTSIDLGQFRGQALFSEDVLDHERVDEHERRLEYPQTEHGEFLFVASIRREVAALAVEQTRVLSSGFFG